MQCIKCGATLPEGSIYCNMCGRKQIRESKNKQRGNGQGTVYKLPNGHYRACIVTGYVIDPDGKRHKHTRSRVCKTKREAVAALPELRAQTVKRRDITFAELYAAWEPTHRAGKSTKDCYRAAFNHFSPIQHMLIADIDIDDLQECIDLCGLGKRTQQNMKTLCGLLYKYGIPRQLIPHGLNYADYLAVGGEAGQHRVSFTDVQIARIKAQIGRVPYAEYVYTLIYLGFRPAEFLALQVGDYKRDKGCIIGGGKTEAGTNRIVTVSPKVRPYIEARVQGRSSGYIFSRDGAQMSSEYFRQQFYAVLEAAGIDNPVTVDSSGQERHKFSPHSCRHTFATLIKRIPGADRDKLELIGHTDEAMLRYYQDSSIRELARITDAM